MTAYEDGKPLYSAMAIHGMAGWETPLGTFVAAAPRGERAMRGPGYDVSNVLFTQYFTWDGALDSLQLLVVELGLLRQPRLPRV